MQSAITHWIRASEAKGYNSVKVSNTRGQEGISSGQGFHRYGYFQHRGPRLLPPVPSTKPLLTVRPRFFGFSSSPADGKRIFLSNDGNVFIAREGEIVNGRYQILHIKQTSVEVEDLNDGVRLTLWLVQG